MPARRRVIGVLQFFLTFIAVGILFSAVGVAQTSLDDVHIIQRQPTSIAASGDSPQLIAHSDLPIIRTDANLVLVSVSVTDPMQRIVTGLHEDNFEVFEGKTPQTIQHFSSEDVPVSLGIILDVSGSMADKIGRVKDAVIQFCDTANPQDEFFLISFADQPRLASDFTTNPEDIKKDLLFVEPKGRTSLLDAVYMGLHKMKRARYGKKALLMISDGGDNHSRYGEREVKALARESDVMIYSIGIFDRYVPTLEEQLGPMLLSEIAEPTGGRAFTIDATNDATNALASVARHIGQELRTQYVLAYRPRDARHDGKWRRIRVRLRLPRKLAFLQAHARTGYYASAEPPPSIATPVPDRNH
jgi:Ca-activated chloride channel homolog